MPPSSDSLTSIFSGWEGYNRSIINAVTPLSGDRLAWRPSPEMRSVGEVVRHIALGRVDWFLRMDAPGSQALADRIMDWETDTHGNRYVIESKIPISEDAVELVRWLEDTWAMVDASLNAWTVDDLSKTFRHTWRGDTYAIPRQWVLWRMLSHDIHHGGELVLMLGMQGIQNFELGDLGGHITLPPLAGAEE